MALTLVTPPAVQPVALDEAKTHLRVDHDDEDDAIAALIDAAVARLDGRDGLLGRALITQTWRLTLPYFKPEIELPLGPLQSVASVSFIDPDGVARIMPEADYAVFGVGESGGGLVRPAYGKDWPSTRAVPEAIGVTFVAGYGDPADVPSDIKLAVLMSVADAFDHGRSGAPIAAGYHDLVANHRTWAF